MARKRKLLYLLLLAFLLLLGSVTGLWFLSRSRTYQVFGEILSRVETDQRVVALTFDDGPVPEATAEILDILRTHNVPATFFLTGREIEKHTSAALSIAQDGHEIGNHTYSHPRMMLKSYGFIADEIERTDRLIHDLGTTETAHFRPPYGKKLFTLPWYLSKHDRLTITWDIEPESYPEIAGDSQKIAEHVLTHTRPGSIILLHVMYDPKRATMNAVSPIITGLKQQGYRFVTISDLLQTR